MDSISIEEAILRLKVAQISEAVGYNAITKDSSNILVDIYRRTIYHLARHCKDAATNNRRVEPTVIDLIQAYDFVGISVPELQEYIETVKLPLNVEIVQDEQQPSNRIQRNLLVDDLLEAEKNSHLEDQEEGESGNEEDEKPPIPLLKDTFEKIASNFTGAPVSADKKIRLGGRFVLVAPKLKISPPVQPDPVPATSKSDNTRAQGKKRKKKEVDKKPNISKKVKTTVLPLDPAIAEPPSFLPILEIKPEVPDIEVEPQRITPTLKKQSKGRKKKKSAAIVTEAAEIPFEPVSAEPPSISPVIQIKTEIPDIEPEPQRVTPTLKKQSKGRKKKKSDNQAAIVPETVVKPLDPAIAEPPSFLPILEIKTEVPDIEVDTHRVTPTLPKPSKAKKKKKSSNQFAIVTETVTATEEKEWFCPACGGPDDGDLMVQCDACQEWYHLGCTNLKKPPEDDENWECDICINKRKAAQKKPPTPQVVEPIKLKTPEPISISMTPPVPVATVAPPLPQPSSSSQDPDLCPECNLPDDGTMMIQCDDPFCAKWFHGKCVNLLEEPKEDESWFCKVCVDKQQSAFKRRRRAK